LVLCSSSLLGLHWVTEQLTCFFLCGVVGSQGAAWVWLPWACAGDTPGHTTLITSWLTSFLHPSYVNT
jgi:hypothetical protein